MEQAQPTQNIWTVKIDSSGRVLLPVELREQLDAPVGTEVQWVNDENGLHLKTYEQVIAEIQEYYCSLAPPERILSEELLEERRREASYE